MVCREPDTKRALVRIVRTPMSGVLVDPTGKQSGRGAYLCHKASCWGAKLKKARVEQALRASISDEQWAQLVQYGKTLLAQHE